VTLPSDDLILNVRQIAQYPQVVAVDPLAAVLVQDGGIGGPYQYVAAQDLVGHALAGDGSMNIGGSLDVVGPAVFTDSISVVNSVTITGPIDASSINATGQLTVAGPGVFQSTLSVAGVAVATQTDVANLMSTTVRSFDGRRGDVYLQLSDITWAGGAPLWSPALAGCPTAPTPSLADNSTAIATTAFVQRLIAQTLSGDFVSSFNGRTGAVVLTATDVQTALGGMVYAPINSPQFTGNPTAPTASPGSSTGQIATTAFVTAAVVASTTGVTSFNTRTGAISLQSADVSGAGGALLVSPVFTGTPQGPTAAPGTNTQQFATTAFVTGALSAGSVSSFNGRTGAVVLTLADVTAVGGAPLASPSLTGVPLAPTASPGTNTTQIATTAFVAANTVASFNGRSGAVTLQANDVSAVGGALLAGPAFSGIPTAPTATAGTNSTQLATCQFVTSALTAGAVTSFNTRTGAISLTAADVTGAGGALLASPSFSGVPLAPTAALATNTTQVATTAFVLANTVASFNGRSAAVTLQAADVSAVGGALLAGPAFTGSPTAPTQTAGTSNTTLATTAFVAAAMSAAGGVTSFNGRAGAVTLTTADVTGAGGAPLASPAFTGAPSLPTGATAVTQTAGNSTTALATTAFVATALGGYLPLAAGGTVTGATTFSSPYTYFGAATTKAAIYGPAGGGLYIYGGGSGATGVQFDAVGNVVINSTSSASYNQLYTGGLEVGAGQGAAAIAAHGNATAAAWYWQGAALAGGGTLVGTVVLSSTNTAYNTTSDARLKTDFEAIDDCGELIDAMEPSRFRWRENGSRGLGFSAQALAKVFPQAVTVGKGDPGDRDFTPWMMDHSKLVPLLVAEIRALRVRMNQLEGRR
jgi:hypothetical protein